MIYTQSDSQDDSFDTCICISVPLNTQQSQLESLTPISMPPKNLSAFLRREVRKDKLKGVPPLKTKDSAFERLNPDLKFNAEMALLFPELVTEKRGRDDSDVDDRGDKNGGANADESVKASSKAERLKKFLEATSTGMGNKSAQKGEKEGMMVEITGSEVKRNELRILRRELEVLVSNQDSLSVKERRGGKVKRRKLLAEIARLEAEIASSDIERLKGELILFISHTKLC